MLTGPLVNLFIMKKLMIKVLLAFPRGCKTIVQILIGKCILLTMDVNNVAIFLSVSCKIRVGGLTHDVLAIVFWLWNKLDDRWSPSNLEAFFFVPIVWCCSSTTVVLDGHFLMAHVQFTFSNKPTKLRGRPGAFALTHHLHFFTGCQRAFAVTCQLHRQWRNCKKKKGRNFLNK